MRGFMLNSLVSQKRKLGVGNLTSLLRVATSQVVLTMMLFALSKYENSGLDYGN